MNLKGKRVICVPGFRDFNPCLDAPLLLGTVLLAKGHDGGNCSPHAGQEAGREKGVRKKKESLKGYSK